VLPVEQFGAGWGGGGGYVCSRWFVVGVGGHCFVVSRGNYMTAVIRNIHLFNEGLSGYL
jgi:hypothetical protein